jgi:RHS repeat-associated protein
MHEITAGRITRMQDASGVQQFSYGAMGEIIQNIHTFVLPQNNTYTLQMNFEYDSWNRIKSIVYPDGEVVTYGYDDGGQMVSMQGMKGQDSYRYIDNIEYNRYGSRTAIEYGNGTSAAYTYDPLMQRLTNLKSFDINQNEMQNLTYAYDAASNIIAIGNSANALPNGLGGTNFNIFYYDSLYRLTYSQGWFYDYQSTPYSQSTQMQYSASGNILSKSVNASLLIDGNVQSVNYQNAYTYNAQQPHTLASAGNSSFGWDANGNMLSQNNRHLCWDEENRLGAVRDPQHLSLYLYNAGGERVWKFTGEVAQMTISGASTVDMACLSNKTLYASSFFVANDLGYTKHYFAGSERVCSKLGGGMALALVSVTDTVVEPLYSEYRTIGDELNNMLIQFANCSPNELDVYLDLDPLLRGIIGDMLYRNDEETERFFYHPDHLGSSSFITDADGEGYQHLQYMPFGETFVTQKLASWSTPYQFSAKEKDDETGFNYFGARYYNSDISVWLSVDPMSDWFSSISGYAYCYNDPINHIDRFGLWGKRQAKKEHRQAVDKYGKNRVGRVHYNIREQEYGFKIYDSKYEKKMDGKRTGRLIGGTEIWDKGTRLYSNEEMGNYRDTHKSKLHGNAAGSDFYLTYAEAHYNYKYGNGRSAYVDLNKLNLSKVRASDFSSHKLHQGNPTLRVNLAGKYRVNNEEGVVYGRITLVLINENTVMAAFADTYDFDVKGTPNRFWRDFGTMYHSSITGPGIPFSIVFLGTAKIQK